MTPSIASGDAPRTAMPRESTLWASIGWSAPASSAADHPMPARLAEPPPAIRRRAAGGGALGVQLGGVLPTLVGDPDVRPDLGIGEPVEPEVLLMSAGFDAHRLDPLASQRLESATFGEITRQLLSLNVPAVVSVLEGGYNLDALGESVVEHVKALHGA